MRALIGLAIGIFLGFISNFSADTKILSVILMAALDAICGGFCAKLELRFSDSELISGFVLNSLFAVALVYIGKIFALELYYIALLVFGLRIFKNLSTLKDWLMKKYCD